MVDLPNTIVDLPNTIVDLTNTMVDLPKTMVDLPSFLTDRLTKPNQKFMDLRGWPYNRSSLVLVYTIYVYCLKQNRINIQIK